MSSQLQDVETKFYGLDGRESLTDLPGSIAKLSVDSENNSTKWFIKFATMGADAGHMFNPQSPNFDKSQLEAFYEKFGRAYYEFRKVSKAAFDYYLAFLKGGNPLHLRQAEREI